MTVIVFALVGGVLGGFSLDGLGGFVFGAVSGAVAGWVAQLASRVRDVERRLGEAQKASLRAAAPAAAEGEERPKASAPRPPAEAAREPIAGTRPESGRPPPPKPEVPAEPPRQAPGAAPAAAPAAARASEGTAAAAAEARARRAVAQPAAARREFPPSPLDAFFTRIVRWFTTGNVPVKVGVVLSLFGVGFLINEGIDRQWLVLPLEYRLMGVALFGIVLLVLGWRLRIQNRTYALSVQGGGVGVLFLVIWAAYQIYDLLPTGLTFGLLVAVTAATTTLAVLQDSRALAVFGVVGGFLAPILSSSGSNDHVALFSYYAVLDMAILAIAWFKAWRMLNVLGFVFTFGIGTLWGVDGYEPAKFATTEPFLVLFTVMYLAIPVLFALRTPPQLRGFVDGTLTFGTPIVAFALQSRLVADTEYGLAISALALAAFYVGMAASLFRTRREELRVLIEAQLALGVAFLTVAVPLALDARWTSAAWALQGAALVWLACRQQRKLALAAGLALQALSGAAYLEQGSAPADWPVLNGYYLGALLLALAGLFSAHLLDPRRERAAAAPVPAVLAGALAIVLVLWGGAWWFFGGLDEIERHVPSAVRFGSWLLFVAGSAVLATLLPKRIDWPRLDWLAVALWPFAALGAVASLWAFDHPAEDLGWLAWPVAIAAMLFFLRAREERFPALRAALHASGYWLVTGLVAWETHWLVGRAAGGVWPEAATLAVVAVLLFATLRVTRNDGWPFGAHARTYALAGGGPVLAGLVLATLALNVQSPGDAAPLRYVPLLNPLELVSVLVVVLLLRYFRALADGGAGAEYAKNNGVIAGASAWFLITMAVARSVHYFAGVAYDLDSLAASTTFQTALSIVWGIAGLAAMIAGTRLARRSVWMTGAGLMAVVVAKLFLVDLGNTGTLARVVSFLGVGVLLLVVGYFSPVPPRAEAEQPAASS
jgi:uncharacterized membrane protein